MSLKIFNSYKYESQIYFFLLNFYFSEKKKTNVYELLLYNNTFFVQENFFISFKFCIFINYKKMSVEL